jgi:acetoin utilization deacetylase AcuC-like enzyme
MIYNGEASNGFALVRPPGHHAEYDHAMGFCLFNNIALGAEYVMRRFDARRVMIVDWDLHHGNGTQNCFYNSDRCLYFSTHQYPYYPGSGAIEEAGAGAGKGFTFNVPIYAGAGDDVYASVYNVLLRPVAESFQPDMILVSAGFDVYRNDPLGGMAVSIYGFAYMARVLLEIAEQCCNGRLLFCLEGGYDLAGLRDGVLAVLLECVGKRVMDDKTFERLSAAGAGPQVIEQVLSFQRQFWPCLA